MTEDRLKEIEEVNNDPALDNIMEDIVAELVAEVRRLREENKIHAAEAERFLAFRANLRALLETDAAGIPANAERIPGHVRMQLEAMLRWETPEERESVDQIRS